MNGIEAQTFRQVALRRAFQTGPVKRSEGFDEVPFRPFARRYRSIPTGKLNHHDNLDLRVR